MSATKKVNGGKRVSRQTKFLLKVKLEGPGIRRKSISIPDLVKVCEAIQSAIHRQAEVLERPQSRTLRPGPIIATAYEECTLELIGITGGSTGLLFREAKPQIPMPGAKTFVGDVVTSVARTVRQLGQKKNKQNGLEVDAGVLDSLNALSDLLGKKSINQVSLTVPRRNGTAQVRAVFTKTVRESIVERIKAPSEQPLTVEGKLEMVDFKEQGKACRVHPPVGLPVLCTFDAAKEDEVYRAVRMPVRVSGIARINANTGKPEELRIKEIEVLDELMLGARDFFSSPSFEQLAEAQGVKPLTNPKVLAGGWPDEDDIDQFLLETYQNRS